MTPTIEIIVTPEGRTSVQTLGFTGPSCRDASKFVELALGQRISERFTAEYHQTADIQQIQQQQL
jgi:hypothetical protein